MPKLSWFKKIWNRNKKQKKKKLYRTKRMESFKFIPTNNVSVRCTDSQGNDITHMLRHSYVYKGVPGGFYIDKEYNKN